MQELTAQVGISEFIPVKPGTKMRKFVAFGHATNLCGFVPGFAVAIPTAPVSSCMNCHPVFPSLAAPHARVLVPSC